MLNNSDVGSNVTSIHSQRCSMTYRPLSHNERVKINAALDSRGSQIEARKALMDSYEWHGKKEERPAYDIFVESEKKFQEYLKNKDPNEKKASDMTPLEFMKKLDSVCGGESGLSGLSSFYEEFFGDPKTLSSIGRKNRMRFFSSREYRLELLRLDIAEGAVKNVDDAEEIKKLYEKSALEQNLISEEKAAVIRAMSTPGFN